LTPEVVPDMILCISRRRGGLETLLYLDTVGHSSRSKICRALQPSPATIGRTLDAFTAWGLVASSSLDRFPFTRTYSLTAIGRALVGAPLRTWPALVRNAYHSAAMAPSERRAPRVRANQGVPTNLVTRRL
jgi:DNA-binding HxlR family transcriptional regulator